jgi:hypothetical protein
MTTGSNWARRYGPNHRRLCARPGCGAPAAATLRFQPTQREAWLVDLDDDAARTEGDLCARHAAGLVLPRGWQLHDGLSTSRTDSSRPVPPPARPRRAAATRTVRRRRIPTDAIELPGLTPVAEPEPKRRPVVPATETATTAPTPPVTAMAAGVEAPVVEPPPTVEPEPVVEVRPEPAPLIAPPTAEETEALSETLDAQTPLLRRAFSNILPPEDES